MFEKVFLCCFFIFCLASCGDKAVDDLYFSKIKAFESAVNDNDNQALLPLVSVAANDYNLISSGDYFSGNNDGTIFTEYLFEYSSCVSTNMGENVSTSCIVSAVSRLGNIAVSYPLTATFTFVYQDDDWKILELKQTKYTDEEVLLDELNDIDYRFYELLESVVNGKIFD